MNKPIILVDLDSTIRDTWASYRNMAQFTLKGTPWPEDWTEEGPSNYWFLDELAHPRLRQLKRLWERKGLHEYASPYSGAVEAVFALERHARVYFVTSPMLTNKWVHSENRQWVEYYFGAQWLPRLIQTSDKTLIYGDLLIDDKPYITGTVEFPTWKHILFDQPYNRGVKKPRILNWNKPEEVLKWLH